MEGVVGRRRAERRQPGAIGRLWLAGLLGLLAMLWSDTAFSQQQESVFLPKIDVIAPSPLSGSTARSRRASSAPLTTNAPAAAAPSQNDQAGIDRDIATVIVDVDGCRMAAGPRLRLEQPDVGAVVQRPCRGCSRYA